jgi:hypothetical protein
VANTWYSAVTSGGTAAIVNLAGVGGNLENNQPLPTHAAQLTTSFSDPASANIATYQNFGSAGYALSNASMAYSYFNQAQAGQNVFAAPSLKLTVFALGGTGDNFGQLIYEPYWNNGVQAVTRGDWITENITANTGSGGDNSGGWWWSGGFNIPSGAGGPPLRSLAEWAAAFAAADPTDFANAHIIGIGIGVGTFNQGQIGYVDNVQYRLPDVMDVTYNFEVVNEVPEPASLALWSIVGTAGLALWRRQRTKAAE